MVDRSWVDSRLTTSRTTAVLAVGDLLAIGTFVVAGMIQHEQAPFADPLSIGGVLAPFLIGWGLAALVGGLYTHDALFDYRRALSWTIPAWIFGVLIALGLRATPVFPGTVSGLFPLVAMGFGGLLVVGWRVIAVAVLAPSR